MNPKKPGQTGGCICGAVKYEITAEPLTIYACHCADCQTGNGGSFVLAMRVPPDGIRIIQGEPKAHQRPRSDGRLKNIFRCPICLTAMWGARVESPEYATVYVGTLDDTSQIRPVGHIWISDAQPWIKIPEGDLVYEKSPPDMKPFEEAWKARSS